jgi:phosphate transport system permease protein
VNPAILQRRRFRLLGLTLGDMIRVFFNGNAVVAIVVLTLITIFLFREGIGFFGQNLRNLRIYRLAGLEYVDFVRTEVDAHTALSRELNEARLAQFERLTAAGQSIDQANAALDPFDTFAGAFSDAAEDLRGVLSDLTDAASAIKQKEQLNSDLAEQKHMLVQAGKADEADKIQITPVDFAAETAVLKGTFDAVKAANEKFATKLEGALAAAPAIADPRIRAQLEKVKSQARALIRSIPHIEQAMRDWKYDAPVPASKAVTSFLFGHTWLTASFWQDWYGIVPLFVGSVLVAAIALAIAIPLGISAAIYVAEIANPREKNFIKPCIEFIAALPSVVLGFFGIAVLGTLLRWLSQGAPLSDQDLAAWPAILRWLPILFHHTVHFLARWVPGFPMSERLNALTAGCLLAFIAIPTIFSLAEDALNNVPRHLREASYALGATRFETVARVTVPASLSGIISAILLGFGRVIGETMVVLLCAGNRIAIPDFTQGLGAFFQPVHTMTGIIAQEMGEVVPGSIHYRALFMVGVVLFLLALGINYVAQRIVHRYHIPVG